MSAVYLVVGLRAKPEKIDQVRSDLIEVVAPSRKESTVSLMNYSKIIMILVYLYFMNIGLVKRSGTSS